MQKYQRQTKREGSGSHVDRRCARDSESSPWEQDFLRHKYLGFVHWALGRSLSFWDFFFLFSWSALLAHSAWKNRWPSLWKQDRRNSSSSSLLLLQSALSSASEMWEAAYFNRKPPAMWTPTHTCTHTEMHPNTQRIYNQSQLNKRTVWTLLKVGEGLVHEHFTFLRS